MDNINLYPINEDQFIKIEPILNNDPEKQFVYFFNVKETFGIFLDEQLIGLFTLNKFIKNNLAIHIALLPEYRCQGIGSKVVNKIVDEYGKNYSEVEYFIANANYENERAIQSFIKAGWKRTYEYDEEMDNEGGEFFVIFEKKNPHYIRKVMTYDKK